MRYYRRLYWGEDLKKKKEKIIRRLNTGKLQRDIYVLVLPEHGSNQLEIYNAALFLQPDFPNCKRLRGGSGAGRRDRRESV